MKARDGDGMGCVVVFSGFPPSSDFDSSGVIAAVAFVVLLR